MTGPAVLAPRKRPPLSSFIEPASDEPGNIDLAKRPVIKNPDGSISTVRSMSFGENGREVLVPTVAADGSRILSDDEAVDQYHKTGQHLGKFSSIDKANAYAQQLHEDQQKQYVKPQRPPLSGFVEPAEQPGVIDRTIAAGKDLVHAVRTDPLGTAKKFGMGLAKNVGDAAALSTPAGLQHIINEETATGRGTKGVIARVAGAAGIAGAPFMGAVGIPAEMALNAGIGAAQTPDDPAVGAVMGAAVPGVGRVVGKIGSAAARGAMRMGKAVTNPLADLSLEGVAKGIPESVVPADLPGQPPAPQKLPISVGRAEELMTAAEKAQPKNPVLKMGSPTRRPKEVLPETSTSLSTSDILNKKIDSGELAPSSSGRALPATFDAEGNPVVGVRPAEQGIDKSKLAPAQIEGDRINRKIDSGELQPATAAGRSDSPVGRRSAEQQAAYQQYVKAVEAEQGTSTFEDRQAARVKDEANARTVKPGEPKGPPGEAMPDGYAAEPSQPVPVATATPDGTVLGRNKLPDPAISRAEEAVAKADKAIQLHLAPETAMPALMDDAERLQWRQDLDWAKHQKQVTETNLAQVKQQVAEKASADAEKAASDAAKPAPAPTHMDGETAGARFDQALKDARAVGVKPAELTRRNEVFGRFQDALDAVNGHIETALDGVEMPADRTRIQQVLGLKAQKPRVIRNAGDPVIIEGERDGYRKMGSGLSADYRSYSDGEMADELRRLQGNIDKGNTTQNRGVARQAEKLMVAGEAEFRMRLMRKGLHQDDIDQAIFHAKIGDFHQPPVSEGDFAPESASHFDASRDLPGTEPPVGEPPAFHSTEPIPNAESGPTGRDAGHDPAGTGSPVSDVSRETTAPQMEPAEELAHNWRRWGEPGNEGEKTTLARIKARAALSDDVLKGAKGFRSFADQKADAVRSLREKLGDNVLGIDWKQVNNLSGAEIEGVMGVVQDNERTLEGVSRDIAAGNLTGDDLTHALKVVDELNASTDEALQKVVSESARAGRTLGYLRNTALQSQDPAVWLVKAQKLYGDRPLPATVMSEIRGLAKAVSEACG